VAVSEDVQVLVERVREALTNERVAYADWTPDALAALDALTAALDNTQKELALLEALQRYTVTQRDNAWQALERAERARDDWAERAEKAEAELESIRAALAHPDEPPTEQT
jgi:chromosome segregation ATPase